MNKLNSEFVGKIVKKKLDMVRNKASKFWGVEFWRLEVALENNKKIKEILVWKDFLQNLNIWTDIESNDLIDKRYIFTTHKKSGASKSYRLINWKELNNHGSN